MNYDRIYQELMAAARRRGTDKSKLDGYYERHHIVPRCLGGSEDEANLVLLSAREHFVAHRLLAKAHPDNNDLLFAVSAFRMGKSFRLLTSRQVALAREAYSKAQATVIASGNYHTQTDVHRQKMSDYQKAKVAAGAHQWQTPEHAASRSEAMRRLNASEANPSLKPENRKASSDRMKQLATCPHCGVSAAANNMRKYHLFGRCSSLTKHIVATELATGLQLSFATAQLADAALGTRSDRVADGKRPSSKGWTFAWALTPWPCASGCSNWAPSLVSLLTLAKPAPHSAASSLSK